MLVLKPTGIILVGFMITCMMYTKYLLTQIHQDLYGEFLYLTHNTSFDYWIFGEMSYKIDYGKTNYNKTLYETVSFRPFGAYSVYDENDIISIKKTVSGRYLTYGGKLGDKNMSFDPIGTRKKAYSTSSKRETQKIIKKDHNSNTNNQNSVKIYKEKYNKYK